MRWWSDPVHITKSLTLRLSCTHLHYLSYVCVSDLNTTCDEPSFSMEDASESLAGSSDKDASNSTASFSSESAMVDQS